MSKEILVFASQLKSQLKKVKQQNPNSNEWQHFYKHFKQLYTMIKELASSKQRLPLFFQNLHNGTVDMRMILLADLKKQQNKRKKMEQEYEKLFNDLNQELENKSKKIIELEKKEHQIKSAGNIGEKMSLNYEAGLKDLAQRLDLLKGDNEKLKEKLHKQFQIERSLRAEINMLKQGESQNKYNRRFSASPDQADDNRQCRTFYYDNQVGSFSELPHDRNYTQLDNTYSQQETQRKVKSVYSPNQPVKLADELWRFIFIQASSLEQFLIATEE